MFAHLRATSHSTPYSWASSVIDAPAKYRVRTTAGVSAVTGVDTLGRGGGGGGTYLVGRRSTFGVSRSSRRTGPGSTMSDGHTATKTSSWRSAIDSPGFASITFRAATARRLRLSDANVATNH